MGLFSNVLKRVKEGVPRRPTPPISIGGPGGGKDLPVKIGEPIAPPGRITRGRLQPPRFIGGPAEPPGGIIPLPGRPPSIGRPLPIRPPSIGRPIPPISIGGIGGGTPMPGLRVPGGGGIDYGGGEGPPLLPLQPPADDPLLRPRVDPIARQEPIPLVPSVSLVPGSAEPREQTGLTAAELLELSDEELQRYIPRRNISQGVGSTRRSYDATPSPEEFREQLQRELNPDPNDLRAISKLGPRRYNPIDTSPQPTQDKNLGQLLDIRGTGDDLPPIDQQRPMPPPPLPPKRDDFMSIGGPGGGITGEPFVLSDLDGNLVPTGTNEPRLVDAFDDRAISPLEKPNFIGRSREQIDEMIKRGGGTLPQPGLELPPLPPRDIGRQPIPPQDFGFGPGVRPTEIRGPDGRIIGPAGVTPPDFIGKPLLPPGGGRDPLRYDSVGMPLIDPNMRIGDGSRRRPQPGEPGATPFVPPQQPARTPLSERIDIFGAGKRYDPANLPEGFSFQDPGGMVRAAVMPPAGFVYAYGPDGEQITVPSGEPGAAAMRDRPGLSLGPGGLTPPPPPTPTGPSEIPVADIAPDPVATPAPVIPPAPVTPPASTTVAANQPPVAPPAPTQPPATTTDGVGTAPAEPAPTTTTAPPQVSGETPFAAGVTQVQSGMDPLTEQLLFGIGGQGGFIPGAMRAAEKVFYDDQGQPIVIDEQVAGFSPDQLAAMQLQRQSIGVQNPFIDTARGAYFSGLGALQSGVGESLGTAEQSVSDIARGVGEARGLREAGLESLVGSLDEARSIGRGATDRFGRRISGVERGAQRAAGRFARGLGRAQRGLEGAVDQFGNRLTDVEGLQRGATDIFGQGVEASQRGLEAGVDQFGNRLTDVEGLQRGATDQFGRRAAGVAGRAMSDVQRFYGGLQDPESLYRGTVGGFDQGLTRDFYDPFEERVVQQTIQDVMEKGAKSDIGARASDLARAGQSAFGSRARLGATERTEALGRGLAEALGGIRSGGFQRAQQAALGEFARQKQAERAAASGLAGLAGQRLGAGQQLTGMLRGLSGEQLAAQQALASGLGSIAGQRLGATRGVEEFRRSGAGQQLAAQQALSDRLSNIAGQRLGAGQSLAEFRRGTAGQQLASQQALQNMLRGTAQDRLAAQQNLGATLAGLGTTQQQAMSQAGQQALAAQQALGSARSGLAGMQMRAGEALQQGQFGLASALQGLGSQAQQAAAADVAGLYGMGAQQQQQAQAMLDAQRRNLQQRQMTPLLQYQALAPFISMAPAGQFQTTTQFAPKPSAMQAGLGTGLSAFGALGQLYGGKS